MTWAAKLVSPRTLVYGTTEYLVVEVTAEETLTAQPVAISVDRGITWHTAAWKGDEGTVRAAQVLATPGVLGGGFVNRPVLVRITHDPELPWLHAGTLTVNGPPAASAEAETLGVAAHEAAPDPHPQYAAAGDVATIAAAEVAAHEGEANPHPVYALAADLTAHEAATNPHPAYVASERLLPGQQALAYPTHLNRWFARLPDSRQRLKHIGVIGHSVAQGAYSNDTVDGTAYATFRTKGYVPQMRAYAAAYAGVNVGAGFFIVNESGMTSQSGAQSIQTFGPYRTGFRIDATTDHVTWTSVPGRYLRLRLWYENTNFAAPTVTVNGGAPVTVTGVPAVNDTFFASQVFDAGTVGSHTVVVNGPGGGKYADVGGLEAYDVDPATSPGIAVHRIAQGGGKLADAIYTTGDSSATSVGRSQRANMTNPAFDLLVLHFRDNESSATGQSGGFTPTAFAARLTEVCNFQTNTAGGAALIVAGPPRDPSSVGPTHTEAEYNAAMRSVAEANPNVAFLDASQVSYWSSWATANGYGLMQDVVHPNLRGHSNLARLVSEAIGVI